MTNITHQGGLVFHVKSDDPQRALAEDGKDFYVVDLTSYGGNSKCDCRHFRIEIEPLIKARTAPHPFPIRCKHGNRCLQLIGEGVVYDFLKLYGPTLDT